MDLRTDSSTTSGPDGKGVSILARSMFRQMRHQGYSPEQIIRFSAELLQFVREDLAGTPDDDE